MFENKIKSNPRPFLLTQMNIEQISSDVHICNILLDTSSVWIRVVGQVESFQKVDVADSLCALYLRLPMTYRDARNRISLPSTQPLTQLPSFTFISPPSLRAIIYITNDRYSTFWNSFPWRSDCLVPSHLPLKITISIFILIYFLE